MNPESDIIRRFLFEGSNVRGVHIHLHETWCEIARRNQHPEAVRTLLGEAVAASMLLAATIKIDGSLTMQTSGDGPVTMLVVQATAARTVRGMASVKDDVDATDFRTLLGEGHLAITIDPGTGGERYQGIISLEGDVLAEVLDGYFVNSEQLPTRLWLAADGEHACGLLLQQLPGENPDDEPDEEAWQHVTTLAQTVKPSELLALDASTLLNRLFATDAVRLFDGNKARFYCRCSRTRVAGMLTSLSREELLETAEEEGGVLTITCDFCNEHYAFDPIDIEQLFVDDTLPVAPSTPQ
jgi:molecular chaperone Hsp33